MDPNKFDIVSDFDLPQEEMKAMNFEAFRIICFKSFEELDHTRFFNLKDAKVNLDYVRKNPWPFGIQHLVTEITESYRDDPFDYSFMEMLPREYQDLSDEARCRYVLNTLMQQFYKLFDNKLYLAQEKSEAEVFEK